MGTPQRFDHAVVIGGSMAGLLAARVLSDHFRRVTILERDPVHDHPESRKGQPQTRHIHALLAAGLQIIERYFPDLEQALIAGGAYAGDPGEGMVWYTHGAYRKVAPAGFRAVAMSRPFLEHEIRRRVLALPNVSLHDQSAVRKLLATPDRLRITGVLVEGRNPSGPAAMTLRADLVLDCSGRGSRVTQWLPELGYEPPAQSEVTVDVAYSTRLYDRDLADPRGRQWIGLTPEAPHEKSFALVFPIEGSRWILTMGSAWGEQCPLDDAGYLEFARRLPAPDIYNLIRHATPLSDAVGYNFRANLRRHYEKLARFPAGLLVLGDALCSFNPVYGQGMTSAAQQAQALDELLQNGSTLEALAPAYFRRASRIVDIPWQMAVGEDFRYPQAKGPKPRGTDFINRYGNWLHRASHHDEVVTRAFLRVMHLLAPPQSLFHPRILWRVLRYGGKRATRPARAQAPGRVGREVAGEKL